MLYRIFFFFPMTALLFGTSSFQRITNVSFRPGLKSLVGPESPRPPDWPERLATSAGVTKLVRSTQLFPSAGVCPLSSHTDSKLPSQFTDIVHTFPFPVFKGGPFFVLSLRWVVSWLTIPFKERVSVATLHSTAPVEESFYVAALTLCARVCLRVGGCQCDSG